MSEHTSQQRSFATTVRVGTMGWGYADWLGSFYPTEAASKEYIALYAKTFDAVEIDSTFYGTPRETQIKAWAKATPPNFVFCPKVPRTITHEMRLIDAQKPFVEFVSVMALLGAKRGPMLLQFPPDFTRHELDNLRGFLPVLKQLSDPSARFAIEFRHRSLIGQDVSALLAEHNIALAAADYVGMPRRFELTSDFIYLRLIGRHGDYPKHDKTYGERPEEMKRWSEALRENAARYDRAYIFANNDYEGYSPATCNKFKELLGLPVNANPPAAQGSLF